MITYTKHVATVVVAGICADPVQPTCMAIILTATFGLFLSLLDNDYDEVRISSGCSF